MTYGRVRRDDGEQGGGQKEGIQRGVWKGVALRMRKEKKKTGLAEEISSGRDLEDNV